MGTMRLVVDALRPGPAGGGRRRPARRAARRPAEPAVARHQRSRTREVELLRQTFGFHELALEEVTRPHERPRCDAYAGYYFIVVYAAEQSGDAFLPRELNLFWGENYLVTIHRRPAAVLAVLDGGAPAVGAAREAPERTAIACLAYTLFESLVDGYFVVQDRVRERIEGIEEAIFTGAEGAAADLFRLRKELLRVPRLLAPTSHVLAEVLRRERTIPDGLRPYFADVQDHAIHVLAELDTYRDLLGAALDVHVFYAFNRLGRHHETADRDHA